MRGRDKVNENGSNSPEGLRNFAIPARNSSLVPKRASGIGYASPLTLSRANTSGSKKSVVETLIDRFETQESTPHAPTAAFERSATQPALSLHRRYQAAVESKKPAISTYQPSKAAPKEGLRQEDIRLIEKALKRKLSSRSESVTPTSPIPSFHRPASKPSRVKVKASTHSITIVIPKGAKLPVVATIKAADPIELETPMSTSPTREESEISDNTEPETRQSSPQNIVPEVDTHQASKGQHSNARLVLPLSSKSRKGRLNVSEASIAAAESSKIFAQGQVVVLAQEGLGEKRDSEAEDRVQSQSEAKATPTDSSAGDVPGSVDPPQETDPRSDPATETREASAEPQQAEDHEPDDKVTSTSSEGKVVTSESVALPETTTPGAPKAPVHLFTQSESAAEDITESFAKFGPAITQTIPEIRVHRPSGTVMDPSLGTSAMNSTTMSDAPAQAVLGQTPASPGAAPPNTPAAGVPAIPTPANLAVDPSVIAQPISAVASATTSAPTGLPLGGKGGKKRKIIKKTRKLVVRKRLLAMILGRDLANLVHPQLNAATNLASGVPLPVDGPSDLLSSYAQRTEHNRDIRQKQLDQKIAAARIHAEAEEMHRCRICRGLTRTAYLRRYHRHLLKRDRPDMSTFDRHATAMARVAAFKCKCSRRLLGVESEVTSKDPTGTQHLRAPAAIEPALSGTIDGQQQ